MIIQKREKAVKYPNFSIYIIPSLVFKKKNLPFVAINVSLPWPNVDELESFS